MNGPVKKIKVGAGDMSAAESVAPPRGARTESAKSFAVLGAAILEKLCRSGRLSVYAKRALPYVMNTARGKVAVSVMVSTVSGDVERKHMLVPLTSLGTPPMASGHVIVCAFVSKRERERTAGGGVNVKLVGWATADEVRRYVGAETRVNTPLTVAAMPVSALRPIQTLRHYLAPQGAVKKEGENT